MSKAGFTVDAKTPRRTARPRERPAVCSRQATIATMARPDLPDAIVAILDEHTYMWRLLTMIEDLLRGNQSVGRAEMETVRGILHYMVHYPDRYHHPKEDLIFERAAKLDASLSSAVRRLRRDHGQMAQRSRELLALAGPGARRRNGNALRALRGHVSEYVEDLRTHMHFEEANVLTPATRLLRAADWRAIDERIGAVNDPLFGSDVAAEYLPVFGRYVNNVTRIATGTVPVMLIERLASTFERAMHAQAEVRRLPGQICREVLRRADGQPALAAATRKARSPARSAEGARPLTKEELADRMERPLAQRSWARVSWQATAMNLLLRLTLKPVMEKATIKHAVQSRRLLALLNGDPAGATVTAVGTDRFRGVWIRPGGVSSRRTVLHLPGGGFVAPAVSGHKTMLATVCREAGAQGLLVHYRLAPEHPFPAGLEDAVAAYRYLLAQGVEPRQIVVMGDSAGGGLTLSLLITLRQQGIPLPAGAVMLSALTDLTFSTPSRSYNRWRDPLLPAHRSMRAYETYAGDVPLDHPLVSPIYGDFRGFPAVLAQVSSNETLLDDTLRVARRARAQGVDFEVEVWDGLPHDWHVLRVIPESAAALRRVGAFVSRRLGTRQAPPRAGR